MDVVLYGRFCRLCKDSLSEDRYSLYRSSLISTSRTKVGDLLLSATGEELSLEAASCPRICKRCYNRVLWIPKAEEDVRKKLKAIEEVKNELRSSMTSNRNFFAYGKRSRIPTTPGIRTGSPTASPPLKRPHGKPRCARDLLRQMDSVSEQRSGLTDVTDPKRIQPALAKPLEGEPITLAKPKYVEAWTQTLLKEDYLKVFRACTTVTIHAYYSYVMDYI